MPTLKMKKAGKENGKQSLSFKFIYFLLFLFNYSTGKQPCRLLNTGFHNEEHLLRQFAAGEQAAFEAIFNEWYARLVFFAQRFSLSKEEAEDVVTESFTKLWMSRNSFDAINKIKSFLYITSRNAAIDALRRRNKAAAQIPLEDQHLELPVSPGNLESIQAEVIGAIFLEIEKLPKKCKQVMLLTYKEGLSTQEIAEKLGISVSNVTSQRSRAVSLLKVALLNKYPILVNILLPELLKQLFKNY